MMRRESFVSLCVMAVAAVAVVSAQSWPRDVGVPDQEWQNSVYGSVTSGMLSLPMSYAQIRTLPLARRVDVVTAAATGAKAYLSSDAFRARYAKDLADGRFGETPPVPARTFAEHLKEEQGTVASQVADLKKSMAEMPPNMRGPMQAMITEAEKAMQNQLRELSATSAADKSTWEREDRDRFTQQEADYAALVREGTALPRDANALVRRRLQEFLTQTADVDFSAALNSQQRFIKPAYEAKPKIWKSCYRAGRLATEAARLFVQSWLKDASRH